jgi:hypothetical protein
LPDAWGKRTARSYARLVHEYRERPNDDVAFVLLAMASLINGASYGTRRDTERYFAVLRRWNKTQATQTTVVCPRCGEFRFKQLRAESGHVRCFHIDALINQPDGPVPLVRPCADPPSVGLVFRCLSCGQSWQRADNDRIAFYPEDVPGAQAPMRLEALDPKNLN